MDSDSTVYIVTYTHKDEIYIATDDNGNLIGDSDECKVTRKIETEYSEKANSPNPQRNIGAVLHFSNYKPIIIKTTINKLIKAIGGMPAHLTSIFGEYGGFTGFRVKPEFKDIRDSGRSIEIKWADQQ